MNPYLAIIKDSFREAFASRVLPFLLLFFTVALALIAPVGLKEEPASLVEFDDLVAPSALVERLRRAAETDAPSPGRHIWSRIPEDVRQKLTDPSADDRHRVPILLRDELNRQLVQPDFYDPPSWSAVPLPDSAAKLLDADPGNLSAPLLLRRNRIALDAALPGLLRPGREAAVRITYFGSEKWPVLDQLPALITVDPDEVRNRTEAILAGICTYLIGKFGVFVAILVSAGIIPRMFEPGSIDLLLSKPLSRTGLFLTKFVSGCAFIVINVAYFMVGVWLIVGLRLDVWSSKLLLTIPVFLFIFAIVYSFSAVAGVLWRNPIVSVMFACVAWMLCSALGQFRHYLELSRGTESVSVLIPAGDDLLMTERSGTTRVWSEDRGTWKEVFEDAPQFRASLSALAPTNAPLAMPLLGPVHDPVHERIAAVQMSFPSFDGRQSPAVVVEGTRESGWRAVQGIAPPPGTSAIFFDARGALLAAGPTGVYRCDGPLALSGAFDGPAGVGRFTRVAPVDAGGWSEPFAAALFTHPQRSDGQNADPLEGTPAASTLAVYSRGTIGVWRVAGDRSERLRERDLETASPALVGIGARTILVALREGRLLVLDSETLETVGEHRRPHDAQAVRVSFDGRWFAVVTHDKRLWLYDGENRREVAPRLVGQGDVTAAAFDHDGRLLVADRVHRVTRYRLDDFARDAQLAPPEQGRDLAYRYVFRPLYAVFPKPGDLDLTVQYLFTDEQAETLPGVRNSLQARRIVHDVWGPVWSNLAILAVILGLTSWHISRRDF